MRSEMSWLQFPKKHSWQLSSARCFPDQYSLRIALRAGVGKCFLSAFKEHTVSVIITYSANRICHRQYGNECIHLSFNKALFIKVGSEPDWPSCLWTKTQSAFPVSPLSSQNLLQEAWSFLGISFLFPITADYHWRNWSIQQSSLPFELGRTRGTISPWVHLI